MTEITPAAPLATIERAAGFFYCDDVGAVVGQSDGGLWAQVDARAARNVVEHNGQRTGLGYLLEVLVESFLRRLVVVWAYAQYAVDAAPVSVAYLFDHGHGVVAAASHEDWQLAVDQTHNGFLDADLLFCAQTGCFACRGKDAEEVGTTLNLELYYLFECFPVNRAVAFEWSNEGNT